MAEYSPESLGIKAPTGGFQQGGWYNGRQYWGGTLADPGVIHSSSNQQGAGQAVSAEVNAQSAAQQGQSPQQLEAYLQQQRQQGGVPAQMTTNRSGMAGGTAGASGMGSIDGLTGTPQATLDLPTLYQNLYKTSGITELEKELSDKAAALAEVRAKNNDNPFLSEATRVGRERKIQEQYDEQTTNLRNDVATRKADIETQLNLQTKQFDINSQAAQQAMSQFNALLESGALAGASGEDIANITRSTGISSSMIQSAIQNAQRGKISVSNYDDGTNEYFVSVDEGGNIVNRQLIGPSKQSGSGSTSFADDFIAQLLEPEDVDTSFMDIADEVLSPQFTPKSGVGTIYTDELGRTWQYQNGGWRLI